MRFRVLFAALSMIVCLQVTAPAQTTLPLVYEVENTGADVVPPYLPASLNQLPVIRSLPDPFEWADGRGRISYYSDWRVRRAEIGDEIQRYEIGIKPPPPDSITASYSGDTLKVNVSVNGRTLTLTSLVVLPSGTGPFPAVIGIMGPTGSIPDSIFSDRSIAEIAYNINQVTTYGSPSTSDPYYKLYPNLNPTNTGQYSAWAWGVSRIIDGLEIVQSKLPIDLKHIAVTGCSYAGKLALFAGAFDERIALTIAQESGGGGATSWRYSHTEVTGSVEDIDNTDYNWFADSLKQFAGDNVYRLPEDHDELMAMVAPRALYVTGNPDYAWLSNPSCYVCSEACKQIYDALGIPDRFGFSIVGGHSHCQVPNSQIPEIIAFVDKFLLADDTVNTSNVSDSPYSIDLSSWITWMNPVLTSGTSYLGRTSLISPPNLQKGMDTTVTFQWNKVSGAEGYFVQITSDPTLSNIGMIDSTIDTVITVSGLMQGKQYYWRVQVQSAAGAGPFSDVRQFSTSAPLPARPGLIAAIQDSVQSGYLGYQFYWNKVQYADQYVLQISNDSTFLHVNSSTSSSDTTQFLFGFLPGSKYFWEVQANNVSGFGPWSGPLSFVANITAVQSGPGLPKDFSLSQNYPNPFNPSTHIKFALPKAVFARLIIRDILGREVKTLVSARLAAGYYEVNFDASKLPSGVYFYTLQTGSFSETKKLLLLK